MFTTQMQIVYMVHMFTTQSTQRVHLIHMFTTQTQSSHAHHSPHKELTWLIRSLHNPHKECTRFTCTVCEWSTTVSMTQSLQHEKCAMEAKCSHDFYGTHKSINGLKHKQALTTTKVTRAFMIPTEHTSPLTAWNTDWHLVPQHKSHILKAEMSAQAPLFIKWVNIFTFMQQQSLP